MTIHLVFAAAQQTLPGLAQNAETLLSGTFGWLLLIGLMVAGLICFFTRHHGAFAVDVIAACFIAFFVFNAAGAEAILKSVAAAL